MINKLLKSQIISLLNSTPSPLDATKVMLSHHDNDVLTDVYYNDDSKQYTYQHNIESIRLSKIKEIEAYDSSDAVNSFTLNGASMWLTKDLRASLFVLTQSRKLLGESSVPLSVPLETGTIFIELPADNVLGMLAVLETYSSDCKMNTDRHMMHVKQLTNAEAIRAYDHTANYPNKPKFTT